MSTYAFGDELEALLDDLDLSESDERVRRPPVRTPSPRSSFQPRQGPAPATQTQVQAAARNLDVKIETLSTAVKALETRTNALSADHDRTKATLRKEVVDRRRTVDAIKADLQQTKMMSVLLPLLTAGETVTLQNEEGKDVKVVGQSDNQLAGILPFLLLMGGGSSGGDASKGPLGDSTSLLLMALVLSRK